MIFLDETGKRWQRIKFGTGMLSTTVLVPVVVLFAASLLYLPNWGSFSLPKSFSGNSSTTSSGRGVQAFLIRTGPSTGPSTHPKSLTSTASSAPPTANSTATTTTPPVSGTAPTTTPTQSQESLASQPPETGNSTYGHSHQPTRS